MKKILFALLVSIAFLACEGPEGDRGLDGKDGRDGKDGEGIAWYVKPFTIKKWTLNGGENQLGSYYYADVDIPELSELIYKNRAVVAYIDPQNEGFKIGLPHILHQGEKVDGKDKYWTQTYDFDFKPGKIRFYVNYSDFSTVFPPAEETFYVVLME